MDQKDLAHARLSASGAHRWMNCPLSVALEDLFEDTSSPFAEEGTLAHSVAEILLLNATDQKDNGDAEIEMNELNPQKTMLDYVGGYVDRCLELYDAEKLKGNKPVVMVEERVEYTEWVPGGFGTCDFIMISGTRLVIRDLKYGKGVEVSAVDNPQTRLYALGVIQEYGWIYDIETVEMHIDQPRLNNITVEIMSLKELIEWAEREIRPRAELAENNIGEYNPGPWCQFCKARATCRARAVDKIETLLDTIKKGKRK